MGHSYSRGQLRKEIIREAASALNHTDSKLAPNRVIIEIVEDGKVLQQPRIQLTKDKYGNIDILGTGQQIRLSPERFMELMDHIVVMAYPDTVIRLVHQNSHEQKIIKTYTIT